MPYGKISKKFYEKKRTVLEYALTSLQNPEVIIFIKYREYILNKHILDIGCGAGRTTLTLKNLSPHYIGIDFSCDMIEYCKKRFADTYFIHGDVRDLRIFKDGMFDFVLFSYNGLDSVGHEERLEGLREVHRVLKKDGLFVFSSHNRNYQHRNAFPQMVFTIDPCAQIRNVIKYLRSIYNYKRIKHREQFHNEFSIINDKAHYYSLLTYYIDRKHQASQINKLGFEVLEFYDIYGSLLNQHDDDSHSAWIYYVTRKSCKD